MCLRMCGHAMERDIYNWAGKKPDARPLSKQRELEGPRKALKHGGNGTCLRRRLFTLGFARRHTRKEHHKQRQGDWAVHSLARQCHLWKTQRVQSTRKSWGMGKLVSISGYEHKF